ncbi:copper amine oxidase N-terminal domain-containing protein [Paenibacillus sp. CAA11]|uniref:copper amine oxidase N-terminal domain-containing protein n=1 Tax=Paenibacillus sp. CAA11 TaxID=1532905 RepID=UPI00131F1231|nr:copper amine oxidase N-terminal domain-containing protein [Paenibacillus sp. CAA11]
MKKSGIIVLVFIMFAAMLPGAATAASLPLRVEVDGEKIWFPDEEPFVDKNMRVQVPIRFISEALGAKVDWSAKQKKVTISQSPKVVTLTIGNKVFYINGTSSKMDTSAMAKGSRTFVPLRFVSQALGAQVNWNKKINTVEITTANGASKPKTEEPKKETTGTVKDWYGFKVVTNSDSKLDVSEGYYEEDKESYLFSFVLTFGKRGEDHAKQLQEVEDVLRQKVNSKTVDSIMKYISSKTKREQELPNKFFEDSKYKIGVGSQPYGGVGVRIWYK